jgi:hypothetical protein
MPYRLKPQRSVASEVKRIVGKQLALAIGELRTISDRRSDGRIHQARRHVNDRVLPRVAAILRRERRRLTGLTLTCRGFHAVGPGLEKSLRRARKAWQRALRHPSADNYHRWRRRVKDLPLDNCLGEYHNVILLEEILITESLLPRQQIADGLRLLRRYQAELRDRAASLGRRLFDGAPSHFVRRVNRLWHAPQDAARAVRKNRWPRAA